MPNVRMEYESEALNLLATCTGPKMLDLEAGLQRLKADSPWGIYFLTATPMINRPIDLVGFLHLVSGRTSSILRLVNRKTAPMII